MPRMTRDQIAAELTELVAAARLGKKFGASHPRIGWMLNAGFSRAVDSVDVAEAGEAIYELSVELAGLQAADDIATAARQQTEPQPEPIAYRDRLLRAALGEMQSTRQSASGPLLDSMMGSSVERGVARDLLEALARGEQPPPQGADPPLLDSMMGRR